MIASPRCERCLAASDDYTYMLVIAKPREELLFMSIGVYSVCIYV